MPTLPSVRLHSNMTIAQLVNAMNENMNLLQNESRTLAIKDEEGTNRILIGKKTDDTYGIVVSKPGINVAEATNDQLVFNSNNNIFKIVATGTGTITVPDPFPANTSVSFTVAHGQTAPPAFIAYINIPAGSGVYGTGLGHVPAFTMGGGVVTSYTQGITDNTHLTIRVNNTSGAGLGGLPFGAVWTVRYYILQETAQTT